MDGSHSIVSTESAEKTSILVGLSLSMELITQGNSPLIRLYYNSHLRIIQVCLGEKSEKI